MQTLDQIAKSTLPEDKDPMGQAIFDYQTTGKASKLRVFSSQFDEDEIPVKHLFRTLEEMPEIEQKALELAEGKILDIGAASGCHTLALQQLGKEVEAIDISPRSVEVMEQRKVKQVRCINLFADEFYGKYDTLLMLMNGSGVIGKLANLPQFFTKAKSLLEPGGKILMDSTDLRYLFEEEDGSYLLDIAGDYYGEIDFTMQYKKVQGDAFDWLYIDFDTLSFYATEYGFMTELICQGEHYDYLAQLTLNNKR